MTKLFVWVGRVVMCLLFVIVSALIVAGVVGLATVMRELPEQQTVEVRLTQEQLTTLMKMIERETQTQGFRVPIGEITDSDMVLYDTGGGVWTYDPSSK